MPLLRGESRAGGPAADDADGALELDQVWVHSAGGGGLADQGADGVVGQQVAVDLCRTMAGFCDRSSFPGPRRYVFSCRFPS